MKIVIEPSWFVFYVHCNIERCKCVLDFRNSTQEFYAYLNIEKCK